LPSSAGQSTPTTPHEMSGSLNSIPTRARVAAFVCRAAGARHWGGGRAR
jgi:hypothetical protein